jgi:hypothetical protein
MGMTEYSEDETAFVTTCLALARDVYQSPVRINVRRTDQQWAVEVVKDVDVQVPSGRRSSWPQEENHLLLEQAADRLEALKRLRDSLSRMQQETLSGSD